MSRRALGVLVAALSVAVLGTVLGSVLGRGSESLPSAPAALTVFAAASLSEVMEEIASDFSATHDGVEVRLTYGGSSDLASQINEGAPADAFVSANEAQMDAVSDHIAGAPVICAPQVPCGAATAELATLQGLTLAPASEEQSVTDVLGKVAAGQADAGIVYVTDVARADGVDAVPIQGAEAIINRYPAAALTGSGAPALAEAFVNYLSSPQAQRVLAAAGFGAP